MTTFNEADFIPAEAATEPTPMGTVAVERRAARRSRRMRRWLRWSSLTRNILASIKDLGIISVFLALLFFNEEVLGYLEQRGSAFLPSPPHTLDVDAALARLNRGADSLPVMPAATLPASAPVGAGRIHKAVRAEQRLLRAEEMDDINDWAMVISATSDIESARQIAAVASERGPIKMLVYRKNTARLVVPLGNTEVARDALPVVRERYPGSVLVSLSSWCPMPAESQGVVECH